MSSFDVTFLGHQGWLFSAGESRLLVDPLLTPAFGHKGAIGVVYPPRIFSFEAFPRIDALFLTREREDHLDVPSLARIDRRLPVLLSGHSSRAAETLLQEMGFVVHRLRPGDAVTIGDLELHLFAPDLTAAETTDAWDVLPFLVRDRRGHGSFFTTVDVASHDRLEKALDEIVERPPVWCYANNASDLSFAREGGERLGTEPSDTPGLARVIGAHYASLRLRDAEPEAVLLCGGGFAFDGDRAWMNRHVFRADSAAVCSAFAALMPGKQFRALVPGETASMREGAFVEVHADRPFLRCAPREEWPARDYAGPGKLLEGYAPATEARDLDDDEIDELGAELDAYAAHLCSRQTFRSLLSLDADELDGRRPTFALVALCDDDGGAYIYEYDPAACAFTPVVDVDPVADYAGGIECWASDLLAVFRGELAPSALWFGRSRSWNALPERCTVDWRELSTYCHPLRRPDQFLHFYRLMLLGAAGVATCVQAAATVPLVIAPRVLAPE